jgi:transposase
VGLDVHARSVVAAAIDGVTGEFIRTRLTPAHEHVRSWLSDLPGPVAVAYEAGPTGFGLARSLIAAGIRCEVVATSKLQRPSGDRVKTDARDAVHLARLLRLDEYVAVSIPTMDQEHARDLVRPRRGRHVGPRDRRQLGRSRAEGSWRQRLAWSAARGAVSGGVHFLLERIWDLLNS